MRITPSRVNLNNLDSLAFTFPGRDGRVQTGHAIYAEPVDRLDPLGPVRQLGDDDEGFSCVDDVARVALIYLEQFEKSRQPQWAEKAELAVRFCLNQEDGQGTYYNFVEKDGKINQDGPTSKPGLNWWAARAFWALSRAQRVLPDSPLQNEIAASRQRTLERLQQAHDQAQVPPELAQAYAETGIRPGGLVDHSGSITSIFALALLESPDTRESPLLVDYCDSMARLEVAPEHPLLAGLHLNSLSDRSTVHLYGNHQVGALAQAGALLQRQDWIDSARREADGYPRMLASHQLPFAYSPAPEPGPQIAYAAETTMANLQALYQATGEEKYSDLAGLFGTWFSGANVAGKPVYHAPTGRAFDGVDPQGVSTNSGAESNVEAQLAMSAMENSPGQRWLSFGHIQDFSGEKLRTDFQVAAGQPQRETRTLNGGAQRTNWRLGSEDRLQISSQQGLLVWKGENLTIDPDGPGPLPAYRVEAQGGGWQTTALPDSAKLEIGGTATVDSLVERPANSHRSWSDGTSRVELEVGPEGWRIG
ncbi:hypothetical protein ABS71_18450 [bacterium SCN 62-11]|nr:hypothetical protein [Candidatus Eremiobacteraeota bacterium]ODT58805.1 MAG: hypothetical protein ABS71_18450 [bacterium SCN 62-11]